MNLDDFLSLHNNLISSQSNTFCQLGINLMEKSRDSIHDVNHIYRLIDLLNSFLKNEKEIAKKADVELLLLIICWHDTWLARNEPKNILSMVLRSIFADGLSVFVFLSNCLNKNLPKHLLTNCAYCIAVHPRVCLIPRVTLESKIFVDLDGLEEWSPERINLFNQQFIQNQKKTIIKLISYYINNRLAKKTSKDFNFSWPKSVFPEIKERFLEQANLFLSR